MHALNFLDSKCCTWGHTLQVRDLTGTGEVTKRRIKEGVGEFPVDCPLEDCAVRVHYSACLAGSSEVGTASGCISGRALEIISNQQPAPSVRTIQRAGTGVV